ncbi:hypothetical protein Fmac_012465 [Flemingia macrophylla]|uniref:Acid phosphatase n=1 Tax=Flemingia macrophylla TaxID=520843 RepID=A0ABD1MQD8_9FABA
MKSGLGGHYIPEIGNYLLGDQYRSDSKTVCTEAYLYAKTLNITGQDLWVFDIDETTLSNLKYYADHGFGVEPYNAAAFNAWVDLGEAPALQESLKLYNKLVSLGVKIVLLTGRPLKRL